MSCGQELPRQVLYYSVLDLTGGLMRRPAIKDELSEEASASIKFYHSLLWGEQFWGCYDKDEAKAEGDRRQLDVAMNRAKAELHLFAGVQG
jgi:hypothetical protein